MSLILSGTDGLSDVDGTAATPAIRGTDANTGIFFPAADTIAFAEGGAECARFDSSGNFGIGTSSPAQTLHVKTSTSATPITLGVLSNATGLPALSLNGAYASTTMAGIYANGATSTSLYYMIPSGQNHFFGIADVTKMTLNSDGNIKLSNNISVGGATPTTSGAGITFPTTQSASSDAKTLDDYEEGTWTPALSTTTGSISFASPSGTYTKIGRLVYVRGSFGGAVTSSTPTGDLKLTNLPFTVGSPELAAGSTTPYNFTAGAYSINLETLGGTTTAYIFNFANGTRSSAHSYIQNGCALNLSMCYQI